MFAASALRALGSAILGGLAMAVSIPAGATAITAIDDFIITRSGVPASPLGAVDGESVLYRDSFDDGVVPPSSGSFATGGTALYNVLGTYPATAESGGRLGLDSSLGGAFTNANGGSRTLQRSVLLTNTDPADSGLGLKRDFHTFSVYGLFDLTMPPVARDGYGIGVNDGGPSGATESIDLFVRREESGDLVIRFQEQDFLNGVINTLELDSLVAPLAADRIELQLRRDDLTTNALTASYRYWDDGSPLSPFIPMSATADFFTNNGWGRGLFFAVEGVAAAPEPGTLVLLLSGTVAGLLAGKNRRPGGLRGVSA